MRGIQVGAGVLAGTAWATALILLIALAPGHIGGIVQEWRVVEATGSGLVSAEVFGPYVLVARYLAVIACLGSSVMLLWSRPRHPLALLASSVFAVLPLSLGLGGVAEAWPFPYPWSGYLQALSSVLPVLGGLGLVLLAYLFPDGRLSPRWAAIPAAGAPLGLGVFLIGSLLGLGDGTWPLGALLLFGSFLVSGLVQMIKLQSASGPARAQTSAPVFALLALQAGLLLEIVPGSPADLLALTAQPVVVALLPLTVLWSVLRRGLWQGADAREYGQARGLRPTWLAAILVCLAGFGLPLYAAAQRPEPTPMLPAWRPVPVIVDTDLSHDDMLALLVLLKSPAVRVQAVLISGTGEVRCGPGTRNALALLALAGRDDIPVACGREAPLAGNHAFPAAWRENADDLYSVALPSAGAVSALPARDLLIRTIAEQTEPPVLLTLGPLTNVAEALQTEPALADKVSTLFAMGGAVRVAGNIAASGEGIDNASAEWNVWVDPRAANIVLTSGIPVLLVPLDATRHVPATAEFLAALESYRETPVARFAYDLLLARDDFVHSGGYQFWDLLAATLVVREDLARYEEAGIRVIEGDGPDAGRTVIDRSAGRVRFAVWADRGQFEQLVLRTLNR